LSYSEGVVDVVVAMRNGRKRARPKRWLWCKLARHQRDHCNEFGRAGKGWWAPVGEGEWWIEGDAITMDRKRREERDGEIHCNGVTA
jgi:hypothetical protein